MSDDALTIVVLIAVPSFAGVALQYLFAPEEAAWGYFEIAGFVISGLIGAGFLAAHLFRSFRR